ncbi:MAG: 50S ribosomal protein L28 [Victivallaceae bacterium]|nr:50S ribosomal protein L28 [Victivallaceae bacterium]
MSNVCHLCGKSKVTGGTIVRKGLAKKVGGIGMHVVKNTKRTFDPNLQSVRVNEDGTVKTVKMCTACIRTGNFTKA